MLHLHFPVCRILSFPLKGCGANVKPGSGIVDGVGEWGSGSTVNVWRMDVKNKNKSIRANNSAGHILFPK